MGELGWLGKDMLFYKKINFEFKAVFNLEIMPSYFSN